MRNFRWRLAFTSDRGMRVVLATLLAVGLAACASVSSPEADETLVGRVPDLAVESDGTLYVRYAGAGKTIVLIAQWPPDEAGAPAARYRAARLEVQSSPIDVEALAHTGRRVMLLPESEWDSLLTQLLTELAPSAPNEAALAVVQGEDIVFARAGGLKLYRHAQKPAALRVTRLVTEEEFSRRVSAILAERYGQDAAVLFDTGRSKAGRALIFVDVARGQSVLITPSSAPAALGEKADVGLALSLTDAVVVRSHLITPLTQPVTSVTRLTWLTLQTATGLLPHPRVPAGAAAPLKEQGAAMDLDQFERDLDEQLGTRRTKARLTPLIDGDAYFTRLVQAIQEARESVQLRLYIFDTDPYLLRLADLLKERSKTIRVQVLLDQLGTLTAARMPGKPAVSGRDAP
jgi:hypothetical protein